MALLMVCLKKFRPLNRGSLAFFYAWELFYSRFSGICQGFRRLQVVQLKIGGLTFQSCLCSTLLDKHISRRYNCDIMYSKHSLKHPVCP